MKKINLLLIISLVSFVGINIIYYGTGSKLVIVLYYQFCKMLLVMSFISARKELSQKKSTYIPLVFLVITAFFLFKELVPSVKTGVWYDFISTLSSAYLLNKIVEQLKKLNAKS